MKRDHEDVGSDGPQAQEETVCKVRCMEAGGDKGDDENASKNPTSDAYEEIETSVKKEGDEKPKHDEDSKGGVDTTLNVEEAIVQVESKCGLQISVDTTRLQVGWEINDDEEGVSDEIWWGCTVSQLLYQHETYGPVWLLKYDEMNVRGTRFPAEERPVAFCSKNVLVDIQSGENKEGGGNIGLML
eukprot:758060-Hanusia_phi.AAC.1